MTRSRLLRTVRRVGFALGVLAAPLEAQVIRDDLQYFRVDPDFAHSHGCSYADVSAPPRLSTYLQHPDSVAPELRTACDVLVWFGKPGKVQYNGEASLTETWFYFLRRDYSFTLTLSPAAGNRWLLDKPLLLGIGRSRDSTQ